MNFTISLPHWIAEFMADRPRRCGTIEDRMRLVVELARENVQQQTGGPFGAGIFDAGGSVIAVGVNLVEFHRCSILHAEMVAIALAQKALGRYDIGDASRHDFELVASTEPCAMCFGAIPWSGVNRLVCGARDADAREIGFDEGQKLPDWPQTLEDRGISVVRDVLRSEAVGVLRLYQETGGVIYNAGNHQS